MLWSSARVLPFIALLAATACASEADEADEPALAEDAASAGRRAAFEEATLVVEINATDGDAGLQIFLDHEPWQSIAIFKPDGTKLLGVNTRGDLPSYGLTELFSESSEPPFDEFPLAEFVQLFPEGDYTFTGRTIDGAAIQSVVPLSHDFPSGPLIRTPREGASVERDDLVVRWDAGNQPAGVEIVQWQVIVVRERPVLREFSVDMPAKADHVGVPREFLTPGKYKVEVLAIEASGNQTLTERSFEIIPAQ